MKNRAWLVKVQKQDGSIKAYYNTEPIPPGKFFKDGIVISCSHLSPANYNF